MSVTPPLDELRDAVMATYREVLGREAIGPDEDFFAIGGNSIAATLVVARLLSQFGVELDLEEMFETPSAAGVAVALERALRGA